MFHSNLTGKSSTELFFWKQKLYFEINNFIHYSYVPFEHRFQNKEKKTPFFFFFWIGLYLKYSESHYSIQREAKNSHKAQGQPAS